MKFLRSMAYLVILTYIFLIALSSVTCHPHRTRLGRRIQGYSQDHAHFHPSHHLNEKETRYHPNHIRRNPEHQVKVQPSFHDELESEEGEPGPHSYVMTNDHLKSTTPPPDEDQMLQEAFQKHMSPNNLPFQNPHDIYAYKLPSDLWFIVRYKTNSEGKTEKYMNVVSSFTNYLDKLDMSTKSVSVNVSGVETVFRLTSKP